VPTSSRHSVRAAQGLPFTVFQPLYIYGPHTAKDCEQWFMDRVLRDRPVPIPAPGIQLTTLTHVEDGVRRAAKNERFLLEQEGLLTGGANSAVLAF